MKEMQRLKGNINASFFFHSWEEFHTHLNSSQWVTWLTELSLNVELTEVVAVLKDCQGEQRGNAVLQPQGLFFLSRSLFFQFFL